MKNVIKTVTLALLCLIFYNCEKDETIVSENSLLQEMQLWYKETHNLKMDANKNFTGQPLWEQSFNIGNKTYFPLSKNFKKNTNQYKVKDVKNPLFTKELYVLEKKDGIFKESLHVYLTKDVSSFASIDSTIDQSYVSFEYFKDSQLTKFVNSKNLTFKPNSNEEILQNSSKGSACDTVYVFSVDHYSDGTTNHTYLYSYDVCYSTGGGGDGSGGGGSSGGVGGNGGEDTPSPILGDDGALIIFPDCHSFQFEKVQGKPLIATGTKNISVTFNAIPDNTYIHMKLTWNVPFPVYFTFDDSMALDHASSNTASIVHNAEMQTQRYMERNGTSLSNDEIKGYFMERMAAMAKISDGEMHLDNRHNVIENEFIYNLTGTGDCAD